MGWYIDNIEFYRECDYPSRLTGEVYWNGVDDWGGEIEWKAPSSVFPSGNWVNWDSWYNIGSLGLTDGGDFSVAIRWDEGMLDNYEGALIRSIKYFPADGGFDDIVVKIWEGENAQNLIYSETIDNVVVNEWNEHLLQDTITIELSSEYWVGYEIIGQQSGSFPAGFDGGPAKEGYGDMIKTSGSPVWETTTQFGFDNDWNIQMFLGQGPEQDPETLIGFNLLKKNAGETEYFPYDFVEFDSTKKYYTSYDVQPAFQGVMGAYYKVNSLWGNLGDTCISDFALAWEIPLNDFVWIQYTTGVDDNTSDEEIIVYPNPTTTTIAFNSTSSISEVKVLDSFRDLILNYEMEPSNKCELNVSGLMSGIYIAIIETNNGVFCKKFVKL